MRARPGLIRSVLCCLSLSMGAVSFAQAPAPPGPDELVAAHNQLRAKAGVPELKWSDALAKTAQAWAETLRDKGCELEPSAGPYGENLFWAGPLTFSDGRTDAAQVG